MQVRPQQWFSNRKFERLLWFLLLTGIVTIMVLFIWGQSLFMSVRLRFNDLYFVDAPTQNNIVLIAIDDASLNAYGSTPAEWSRTILADFLTRLRDAQPRVVALDLLFTGSESADGTFIQALADLRQNENQTQVVVAGAGVNPQRAHHPLSFSSELPLISGIRSTVNYVGLTNTVADIDRIIRRQPSVIEIGGNRREYSFSIVTYLAFLRIPSTAADQVVRIQPNQLQLPDGQLIQIDELGFWQQNFFGSPQSSFPIISFNDIMTGDADLEQLSDKIVMVGVLEATGNLDRHAVPSARSGELMAGIEIQAHALESILQKNALTHPESIVNGLIIIGVTWLSAVSMWLLRWYFKLLAALIWVLGFFIVGSLLFSSQALVLNIFDPILGIVLVLVVLIGSDISFEVMQRRETEFVLASVQQIAQQRLDLERALPLIQQDIQQLLPNATSINILHVEDPVEEELSPVVTQAMSKSQLVEDNGMYGLPLLWQGKIQIIVTFHHTTRQLTHRQKQRLRNFVSQLNPSLDNIALYQGLQRQKRLVDTIFTQSPVGFALLDNQGFIENHNQYFINLLNLESASVVGQSFNKILQNIVTNYDEISPFVDGSSSDGELFTNLILGENSANMAIASLPEYELYVVVLSDTSTLTELSRLKTEMLRMASHDLKNPLSRILGFSDLLTVINDPLTKTQKEYLEYITTSANDMLRIIEDVLALERLRASELLFDHVDFTRVVEQVCMSHQPDMIRKQQNFVIEKPEQSIELRGNTSQLSQLVANLVGNAIKYTPEKGEITVRLKPNGSFARLEVEDTGYGIPSKAQDKLFTEFFRAKSKATRDIPGTGLGLSLVKTIVEKHGGSVGFRSEEGIGSTFWAELPLEDE